MNSIYFLFAFFVAITQRLDASLPMAFQGYPSYVPYVGAVAAPAPVVHAAPLFYPYAMAYPQRHRELRNFAGAVQREKELLTDVSIRFPAKKAHKKN